MNDTDRGGMTVSSLLVMGLTTSVAIPVIAIIVLGILRGVVDQTVFVYMVGLCALVVLLGVLTVNYFVRRRIQRQEPRRRVACAHALPRWLYSSSR